MRDDLIGVVWSRAESDPQRVAFRFLDASGAERAMLTTAQLARRAAAIAGGLRRQGFEAGQTVALSCRDPAEFVPAFLGIAHAGGFPVPVPAIGTRTAKLEHVLDDCRPFALLLGSDADRSRRHDVGARVLIAAELDGPIDEPSRREDDSPCFIQYTSGSIAKPKGVVVSRAQLAVNSTMIAATFGHDAATRFASWLPLFHDMGLVGAALHPLLLGAEAILMPAEGFQESPVRWLQMISTYRAHTSGAPDFAYRACAALAGQPCLDGLDLSSWRVAYNGAEPVRADTLKRFEAALRPHGFDPQAWRPCYGMAETTLLSTGRGNDAPLRFTLAGRSGALARTVASGEAPALEIVSVGAAAPGVTLRIVDPDSQREMVEGSTGEIWVAGDHVAARYWRGPNDAFEGRGVDGSTRFLRTGDLGFMLDGELHVVGRLKDLIIVAGRNYHPHDLEAAACQAHPALAQSRAAAFALSSHEFAQQFKVRVSAEQAAEVPVVVIEASGNLAAAAYGATAAAVAQAVSEHCAIVPGAVLLIARGGLEVTTSGKVRRGAAARRLADRAYRIRATWLAPEYGDTLDQATDRVVMCLREGAQVERTVQALALACAIAVEAPQPGSPDLPLAAMGLTSLTAMRLFGRISKDTGIPLPVCHLHDGSTITSLAQILTREWRARTPAASPALRAGALSAGALAILQRRGTDGDAPFTLAFSIEGAAPAIDAVLAAARTLPDRIPALRLRWSSDESREAAARVSFAEPDAWLPVRRIGPFNCAADCNAALRQEARAQFDLRAGPLRLLHAEVQAAHATVLVQVHHAAADYWTMAAIAGWLTDAKPIDKTPTVWAMPVDAAATTSGEWRRAFRTLSSLPLPRDRNGRTTGTPLSAPFELSADTLQALTNATGQTPFVVILTCLFAVLGCWSDSWDRAVGVPLAGVGDSSVGYGVRVVPLRAELSPDESFRDSSRHVAGRLAHAISHCSANLEDIGAAVRRERPDITALFDVAAVHIGDAAPFANELGRLALRDERSYVQSGELTLSTDGLGPTSLEQAIELVTCENRGGVLGTLRVDSALFSAATARLLAQRIAELAQAAATDVNQALDMLAERTTTTGWRTADVVEAVVRPLHASVAAWVARTPDADAIRATGQTITYRVLGERIERLARQIAAQGGAARIATRCVDPIAGVVALVAGMAAGGAVMPINPALPAARQRMMLTETGIDLLIADTAIDDADSQDGALPRIRLKGGGTADAGPAAALQAVALDDPAYWIFTSGTEGQPKGIVHTHRTFGDFLNWQARVMEIRPGARVAQIAPPGFDVSLCEIFGALCHGATLVMPDRDRDLAPGRLLAWLDEMDITTLQATPGLLLEALRHDRRWPSALRTLANVGEPLPLQLAHELLERAGTASRLLNIYGPTEAVAASWHEVSMADLAAERIPVGTPIDGRTLEVRDGLGRPVPQGTRGDIYIRSAYLSDGYANALQRGGFAALPRETADGQGLYNTGDIGRWTPDGLLEVVGRRDNQVKVNGVRVELEEIEAALLLNPAVTAALAMRDAINDATARIVAFVEAREPLDTTELRRALVRQLPLTFIPSVIVVLPCLPRNVNGKLNRAELATRAAALLAGDEPRPAALTDTQRQLAELWSAVLEEPINADAGADFFALGGHSIKAMQMLNLLKSKTGSTVSLAEFMAEPTLSALADRIGRLSPDAV